MRTPTRPLCTVEKDGHATSLAPNVIHSLDAAHLMLTVTNAHRDGLTALATVHDGFATWATEADSLRHYFRTAMVQLYEEQPDPWLALVSQFAEQCAELPPPPEQGELKLGVLLSEAALAAVAPEDWPPPPSLFRATITAHSLK